MSDKTNVVPNPGSQEALMKGCLCPVIDNRHGYGYNGKPNTFIMTHGCPLHWPEGGKRWRSTAS